MGTCSFIWGKNSEIVADLLRLRIRVLYLDLLYPVFFAHEPIALKFLVLDLWTIRQPVFQSWFHISISSKLFALYKYSIGDILCQLLKNGNLWNVSFEACCLLLVLVAWLERLTPPVYAWTIENTYTAYFLLPIYVYSYPVSRITGFCAERGFLRGDKLVVFLNCLVFTKSFVVSFSPLII